MYGEDKALLNVQGEVAGSWEIDAKQADKIYQLWIQALFTMPPGPISCSARRAIDSGAPAG